MKDTITNSREEALIRHGVALVVDDLCGQGEIMQRLTDNLLQKEAYAIGGISYPFTEDEAQRVMERVQSAILALALSSHEPEAIIPRAQVTPRELDVGDAEDQDHTAEKIEADRPDPAPMGDFPACVQDREPFEVFSKVRKIADTASFQGKTLKSARLGGDLLDADSPESLIDQMIFQLLLRKSKTGAEDITCIQHHTGLTATRKLTLGMKDLFKSHHVGLFLPRLDIDRAVRVAHKVARALGLPLEVALFSEEEPIAVHYVYDPSDTAQKNNFDQVITCGPGRYVRVRYRDTLEVKAYYIAQSPEDLKSSIEGVEVIGNGQPIAQAMNGYGAGDTFNLRLAGQHMRPVTVLEVW